MMTTIEEEFFCDLQKVAILTKVSILAKSKFPAFHGFQGSMMKI
jgi:hypothetical protein